MEDKVILYNSSDVKIGETFPRRAKQLVRQQRAMWVDDSHTAIRFAPGMENMDTFEKPVTELSLYQLCFVLRNDGYYYSAYTIAIQDTQVTVAFFDGTTNQTSIENIIRLDEAFATLRFQCKSTWVFWDGDIVGQHPVKFRFRVGGATMQVELKDLRAEPY